MRNEGIITKLWRILYIPLLYLGISIVVEFIAMLGYMIKYSVELALRIGGSLNEDHMINSTMTWVLENAVMLTVISGLVTLPILLLLMRKDKRRSIRDNTYAEYTKAPAWQFLLVALIGVFACVGFNLLISLTGIDSWGRGYEDTAELIYGGDFLWTVVGVVFVIPVIEELIFRGLVYKRVRYYFGVLPAIISSAVYFGIYHMNVPQAIYATILGLLMAWIYTKFETIWAPILFHVSANGISVILTFSGVLDNLSMTQFVVVCVVSILLTGLFAVAIAKLVSVCKVEERFDTVIVGAGFAGAVMARELAERGNEKVLVLEKRNHIGGNCYDSYDTNGVLIHNYGPHIFHTNSKQVYDYLSKYTDWYNYSHEVGANINGKIVPVPFNLNTLYEVFEKEEAEALEGKLLEKYGEGKRVPILELIESEDADVKKVGQFVYDNVFLKYTMKQWGQRPEEVDPSVTARVPVLLSRDNRYFQDTYQGMPKLGYTPLFKQMLAHDNIKVLLNTEASRYIELKDGTIYLKGVPFEGKVIFTGPIDEFFDCRFGKLPYRSLRFEWKHFEQDSFQPKAVVNYTVTEDYTRITEFKKLTGQKVAGTTVMREYSIPYTDNGTQIPYYAILNDGNRALYEQYKTLLESYPNFYLLGRLAEYKYYNIDGIVEKALELAERLLAGEK